MTKVNVLAFNLVIVCTIMLVQKPVQSWTIMLFCDKELHESCEVQAELFNISREDPNNLTVSTLSSTGDFMTDLLLLSQAGGLT